MSQIMGWVRIRPTFYWCFLHWILRVKRCRCEHKCLTIFTLNCESLYSLALCRLLPVSLSFSLFRPIPPLRSYAYTRSYSTRTWTIVAVLHQARSQATSFFFVKHRAYESRYLASRGRKPRVSLSGGLDRAQENKSDREVYRRKQEKT